MVWLPHKSLISTHLIYLNNILDRFCKSYENLVFTGDFNVTKDDKFAINLIDKPTCYKNFDKPALIDLILTNKISYFQHSNVFKTSLPDFHLLTVTEFRVEFQKH